MVIASRQPDEVDKCHEGIKDSVTPNQDFLQARAWRGARRECSSQGAEPKPQTSTIWGTLELGGRAWWALGLFHICWPPYLARKWGVWLNVGWKVQSRNIFIFWPSFCCPTVSQNLLAQVCFCWDNSRGVVGCPSLNTNRTPHAKFRVVCTEPSLKSLQGRSKTSALVLCPMPEIPPSLHVFRWCSLSLPPPPHGHFTCQREEEHMGTVYSLGTCSFLGSLWGSFGIPLI